MNKAFYLWGLLFAIGCTSKTGIEILVKNDSDITRTDVLEVAVSGIEGTSMQMNDKAGSPIPLEVIDRDNDGNVDIVRFECGLNPMEELKLSLASSSSTLLAAKKTQAELSVKQGGSWVDRKYEGGDFVNVDQLNVPAEHTDHSNFVRYEGPGWESDKIAYRYYLDWRNGMDIFGKKTDQMVLQNVGLDGFDSYHEPADWGMDVLKVGTTLGLGSIGRFVNDELIRFKAVDSTVCSVSENGLLKSSITTSYFGWNTGDATTDLVSTVTIQAGSPVTAHKLQFSNPIPGFCTGVVANEGEQFTIKTNGDYQTLISYGNFSLAGDGLGLAIIVRKSDIEAVQDGAGSHMVVFKPAIELTYYLMGAWQQDYSQVGSIADFEKLVDQEVVKLNQPVQVTLLR